jgi:hypothetical protein
VHEATLFARSALSWSASLAIFSAWLYQDRAPSRVARSCWSWDRVEVSSASHSAARSASRPGPRALFVAPRPAPEAPTSPSRPQRRLTQPGCPGSGARPAPSAAGTPATRCRSARPPRGCRGSRTASGTSHARSSVEQGDCTSPEPGTPAHVASRRDAGGRKVRK